MLYSRNLFDQSNFTLVYAQNFFGDGWHAAATCCETHFDQIQADSNFGSSGGVPFIFEDGNSYVCTDTNRHQLDFPGDTAPTTHAGCTTQSYPIGGNGLTMSGSFNGPGLGKPNILISPNQFALKIHPYIETVQPSSGLSDNTVAAIDNQNTNDKLVVSAGGSVNNNGKPYFSHPYAVGLTDLWSDPAHAIINTPTLNFPSFGPLGVGTNSIAAWVDSSRNTMFQVYVDENSTQFQNTSRVNQGYLWSDQRGNLATLGYQSKNFWLVGGGRFQANLSTPASSTDTCLAGESWNDANFHYVCVAQNTIKRIALQSF